MDAGFSPHVLEFAHEHHLSRWADEEQESRTFSASFPSLNPYCATGESHQLHGETGLPLFGDRAAQSGPVKPSQTDLVTGPTESNFTCFYANYFK